jgi:hypothetical protein
MVGNGELDSPECCAPYYPFDNESHDRLINTPRTDEITITQHPGDQSMTLHFAICVTYERERERERERGISDPLGRRRNRPRSRCNPR